MKLNEKLTNVDYSNDHVVSDANTATETGGYYTLSTTTNLPISGSAGFLDVLCHTSDDCVIQYWTRYRDNQVFMRQFNLIEPSGWKEWVEISTSPVVLYETSKTFENIADDTIITLNDSIRNYKRIIIFALSNNNILGSVEVYNPTINDQIGIFITANGNRSGLYTFNGTFREFYITSNTQIKYREATDISSKAVSNAPLTGFVNDSTNIKIYAILGFKN